jgi:hypothetical protein
VDPARDGINFYAYCKANPLNLTDPYGLKDLSREESDFRDTYFNTALLAIYSKLPSDISCGTREEAKKIVQSYVNAIFEERGKGFIHSGPWWNVGREWLGFTSAHTCNEWEDLTRNAIQDVMGPKEDENGNIIKSKCFTYNPGWSHKAASNHAWGELKYIGDGGNTFLIIIDAWRTGYPNVYNPNDPYYDKFRSQK